MRLRKIVSGGQTGVDRAALDAALAAAAPVGGWCPKGRRAEDGRIPARYPLEETPTQAYEQRTTWNVRDSDGTLIIGPAEPVGGTAFTQAEARRLERPHLHVPPADAALVSMIRGWGEEHGIRVLNVAGPRASEVEGIYDAAYDIVGDLLAEGGENESA